MAKMDMVSLECPSCGGTMHYEKDEGKAVCPYCGKAVIVRDEKKQQTSSEDFRPARRTAKRRRSTVKTLAAIGAVLLVVLAAIGIRRANRTTADPFENVKVEFSGVSGSGSARIVNSNTDRLRDVDFTVDRQHGLSNGDSVTVTAEKMNGYRWTQSKKTFRVFGLSEILKTLSDAPDSAFDMFREASRIELEKAWKDVSVRQQQVEWNAETHKLYLLVSDGSEGTRKNVLYDTYKTTVTMPDGEERVFYQAVRYEDVIKKPDGSITADYSNASIQNWQLGYYLGFDASDAFYGWERLREMELEFEGLKGYTAAD